MLQNNNINKEKDENLNFVDAFVSLKFSIKRKYKQNLHLIDLRQYDERHGLRYILSARALNCEFSLLRIEVTKRVSSKYVCRYAHGLSLYIVTDYT